MPSGLLVDAANEARAARVAAAVRPPVPWQPIACAPRDGTLIDVLFDVQDAAPATVEFYAPGWFHNRATPTVIENVAFANGAFKPIIDARGAASAKALAGEWGHLTGAACNVRGVTLTHWRPAAYPFLVPR